MARITQQLKASQCSKVICVKINGIHVLVATAFYGVIWTLQCFTLATINSFIM